MAINDIKSLSARVDRSALFDVLLGLGRALDQYCSAKLPDDASIDDLLTIFPEGNREFSPTSFFVQCRIVPKGRLMLRYNFVNSVVQTGIVGFSVSDNGENLPQDTFDCVYENLRSYVVERNLTIVDERLLKEC